MLFFVADDGIHGRELWKRSVAGGAAVLVQDIRPGRAGAFEAEAPNLSELCNVDGTLFFTANDGVNGIELWKSDGTAEGTVLVKDIRPGSAGSVPNALIAMNGTLFFGANDGVNGFELWKSDGTAAGTVLVKDIDPGPFGSGGPGKMTVVNGTLFFSAGPDRELWKSDGTTAGTVLVKDINQVSGGSNPRELTNVNGTLFFRANDGVHGEELWKSDGTEAGTVLVKDIRSGRDEPSLENLINVGGTLFFTANDGDENHGRELWKSDGTAEGTALVKDVNPGPGWAFGGPNPFLTPVNGVLFFMADDGTHGSELWKSDGTEAGTVLVKDINLGSGGSFPQDLINVSGALFFTATDGARGVELWTSDGTEAGTALVKDINPGPGDSITYRRAYLTRANGALFFTATDGGTGREVWTSDGTAAGTVLVWDVRPGSADSSPTLLTDVSGTAFFAADDGIHGQELWKSDGTLAGTVLVKDIRPGTIGPNPAGSDLLGLTEVNGTLFFGATDGQPSGNPHPRLWKSDGTADGTVLVRDVDPGGSFDSFQELINVSGTLFFTAINRQLFRSDGTEAGTVSVPLLTGRQAANLTNVNGTLFFTVIVPRPGPPGPGGLPGLRKIDPATGSVVVIRDGLMTLPTNLTAVNGTLFFGTQEGLATQNGLWKSDGTADGTILVKNLASVRNLTNVNGTLFFTAELDNDRELWKSDGTAEGTVLVRNINPGGSASPANLTNVNGTLFFVADDGVHGRELWKSDGTPEGTVLVRDINPGGAGSNPTGLTAVNGRLYFAADDGVHGVELWQSDGTADSTVLVEDIYPGILGSFPANLTSVNGRLFFTADDGVHGRELWVLPLVAAPPVTVESVVLNDGSAQRSRITSLTVTFSGAVTLQPDAFELRRQGGGLVGLDVATSVVDGRTVAVLTFSGADVVAGSLADGHYALTVRGDQVRDGSGGLLDGDGDGAPGGDRVDAFFRLYGDGDGDGDVDLRDLARFLGTLGRREGDDDYLGYFDYDGDGDVGLLTDLPAFLRRLGRHLRPS